LTSIKQQPWNLPVRRPTKLVHGALTKTPPTLGDPGSDFCQSLKVKTNNPSPIKAKTREAQQPKKNSEDANRDLPPRSRIDN